jgi:hypothetical protein
MAAAPTPNPDTVEALLDTTWRLMQAEAARTESLDRKAATLATFASLLVSLTATLGVRFLELVGEVWSVAVFLAALAALLLSVGLAVRALFPREYLTLGMEYVRRFPTWAEILKTPEQVRGETMRGLVSAIGRERRSNAVKAQSVRWAFVALAVGLALIAVEAATLAVREL